MNLSTLSEWLDWISTSQQLSTDIVLGLERIRPIAERLGVLSPPCPVIIVAGTNGKGSTVAGLEAIYRASAYRTGVFTSPILFKHNEEVRLNGIEATDESFINAFSAIEAVKADIPLTSFEYHTLAALWILKQSILDVWILEVGLGGRLDAVNILDADLAIITSIDFDHMEWLGHTRDAIAYEKAGIFREKQLAICGDRAPPASLLTVAQEKQTQLFCLGRDFDFEKLAADEWSFHAGDIHYSRLPITTLALNNMANVLMGVTLFNHRLPVSLASIKAGLAQVTLPGRIQVIPGEITYIFDVAHNPAAIKFLADHLSSWPCVGKTIAVFSMLGDKDIIASISAIADRIDVWYVAPLKAKRAADLAQLQNAFETVGVTAHFYDAILQAFVPAKDTATEGDRVVVFGSFHTVADVF